MQSDVSFSGSSSGPDEFCVLSRQISAVQLVGTEPAAYRWGPVVKLPRGSQVRSCGAGFNRMTVKVVVGESFYFIFREDFDSQRKRWLDQKSVFTSAAAKVDKTASGRSNRLNP
jgi:hypothetical protein